MKRILTFTVCTLLTAGIYTGNLSHAWDNAPPEEGVNGTRSADSTDSMVREFETEVYKTRSVTDPDEIGLRQYVPDFMRGYTGRVEGTVTLVGDNVMRMSEAGTRFEYEVTINDTQEKVLTTGFNIRADLKDGKLVSFMELGVPPDVEKIVYSAEGLPDDNILEQQEAF